MYLSHTLERLSIGHFYEEIIKGTLDLLFGDSHSWYKWTQTILHSVMWVHKRERYEAGRSDIKVSNKEYCLREFGYLPPSLMAWIWSPGQIRYKKKVTFANCPLTSTYVTPTCTVIWTINKCKFNTLKILYHSIEKQQEFWKPTGIQSLISLLYDPTSETLTLLISPPGEAG